jgi:hypothetical protein
MMAAAGGRRAAASGLDGALTYGVSILCSNWLRVGEPQRDGLASRLRGDNLGTSWVLASRLCPRLLHTQMPL